MSEGIPPPSFPLIERAVYEQKGEAVGKVFSRNSQQSGLT